MNVREINFAYKIRHALNENLDNLPTSVSERLASARKIALSRKKQDSLLVAYRSERKYAAYFDGRAGSNSSWMAKMGFALPILVLIAGLASLYQLEQQQHIVDTAEIDAMVLSDELPLTAYLDHGFNAYLAKRAE